jgi:solute carrier family 36 (proton-coupled amino acid transporter)
MASHPPGGTHRPPANDARAGYGATDLAPASAAAAARTPPPSPAAALHMQTYTAGEDGSRLAEMAREFGLQRQRRPRNQIRERISVPLSSLVSGFLYQRVLDPSFANVRIRSVYMSHYDDDDRGAAAGGADGDEELMGLFRPPSWHCEGERVRDDDGDSHGSADANDSHAAGLGGDLPSAVLGIIKGMVGPAILYLPHGFANAGWAVAVPILIFATVLFLGSSASLLDAWKLETARVTEARHLVHKKLQRTMLSYPELAYRAFGGTGEAVVKIGIALMQSGVCLTYLIFVPLNLKTITKNLTGHDVDASYFVTVMLAFQIPLSWIRDIRKLTITNLLANILILYGLITCLGFAFSNAIISEEGRGPLAEILYKFSNLGSFNSGWFLFIGTSVSCPLTFRHILFCIVQSNILIIDLETFPQVLLFEGSITLLVPLQEAVYQEEDRKKFPEVYRKVILGIISFYSFFGMVCWMSFGDDVKTVMTTSLPDGPLATTVQLAYSIAVIFTFPLQNFPSLEIATRSIPTAIANTCGSANSRLQSRNVIASLLVCLLALVAISTMNSLDKVVSLMGSMLGCPLAFAFPPLIHNRLDPDLNHVRRTTNRIIAFLGVLVMILASVTTLITW